MTDHEIILLLHNDMKEMKADIKGMKADINDMKADINDMKADINDMKADINGVKADMNGVKADMNGMKADIRDLKEKTASLDRRVGDIQIAIENEIRPSIQIIAEGHLDLSRKLDEALSDRKTREMDRLRIARLENDVRQIRQFVGMDPAAAAT